MTGRDFDLGQKPIFSGAAFWISLALRAASLASWDAALWVSASPG
jgi:hypothetical protein